MELTKQEIRHLQASLLFVLTDHKNIDQATEQKLKDLYNKLDKGIQNV
jgi:tRNA pseudouridine-54 N-methylase